MMMMHEKLQMLGVALAMYQTQHATTDRMTLKQCMQEVNKAMNVIKDKADS